MYIESYQERITKKRIDFWKSKPTFSDFFDKDCRVRRKKQHRWGEIQTKWIFIREICQSLTLIKMRWGQTCVHWMGKQVRRKSGMGWKKINAGELGTQQAHNIFQSVFYKEKRKDRTLVGWRVKKRFSFKMDYF